MSRREILWGESWVNIRMMLADQPQYHSKGKNDDDNDPGEEMTDDELIKLADNL